ncbi:MAG: carbohydrate ABC transporter substrate-binding protein [Clostridia bacterium]|nr:carbohydrate ABC transporter substrate-binding protein [Clostridia bacterium]
MNKFRRIFALLLASIITASSCVSCIRKEEEKEEKESTEESIEVQKATLDVPKGIAEGKTFSMYFAMPTVKSSYIAKEETGSEVNDAVYLRNKLVEEHTGVTLDFVATSRTSNGTDQDIENNQIRTLIQAGDATYDAYIHSQRTAMFTLIEEEMFIDWNELPYVNLDNEWWYSNVIRDICYGDKVFAMTGDYNLNSFAETECLLFNKTMLDEIGLEYPYNMVLDGTWTHDRFVEYIKAATKDLNGDGLIKRDDDRLGFGGWQYEQVAALFAGYGGINIKKDDNNLPVLCADDERNYTVIDKMLEVFECDGSFYEGATYGIDDRMFQEGRLLFNDSFLTGVVSARSIEEFDVGFIPYPKLDEDQESYHSRTANVSGLTYIPVTNDDYEMTGAVLEALAYYSRDTMMPVYFDVLLTIKSTRDYESEQMIPIIRNSSTFLDTVIGFYGANIVYAGQGNTLSSYIAANKDAWQIKMETLAELYTD